MHRLLEGQGTALAFLGELEDFALEALADAGYLLAEPAALLENQHVGSLGLLVAVVIADREAILVEVREDLAPAGAENQFLEAGLLRVVDRARNVGNLLQAVARRAAQRLMQALLKRAYTHPAISVCTRYVLIKSKAVEARNEPQRDQKP